jgi:N-acetylmuramoyl-L-alanine amidase
MTMAETYYVQQGDCINSIAAAYGHLPDTIWNDGNNAQLKQLRKDPDVLREGDLVYVPDLRYKQVDAATEKTWVFKRKAIPIKLHVRLAIDDEPLRNEAYQLLIDGHTYDGKTDGNGMISVDIPPNAAEGWLQVRGRRFPLQLGTLDPVDTVRGAQARLNQLGFNAGDLTDALNDQTRAALTAFQHKYALQESGELDAATQDKLKTLFGG